MKRALHAEWTKLRTEGGTGWLMLGVIATTVAVSAGVASTSRCPALDCGGDATRLSLTGVMAGQVVVAIVAVLMIGNEYNTGMIRTTLTAMPRRITVLAAKAAVLTAVMLVAGTVSVLASLLSGRILLPDNGFNPEHGYAALSLTDGPTLRAALGSVLYLALIALLSLGVATAVRNSATAIGIVLALLFVFPILTRVVTNEDWQRHLEQIAPMPAGLAVQSTVGLSDLPIGPWQGLGVLTLWAALVLVGGGLLFRSRDA
ncbi:ABC transporter permease [Streptomyces spiramyceticus]|uniref:ABC transporter permease n=1 Tax=Streptomyces spiramyceticus TaxID=299717 RepID=UPI00237AC7DB|nr:ABC transporter permease subunit [Streptomyces spiramyceticus]